MLFAFAKLGEASDVLKKGKGKEEIAEELVDVLFYVLDVSRLACHTINMDEGSTKNSRKTKREKTNTAKAID